MFISGRRFCTALLASLVVLAPTVATAQVRHIYPSGMPNYAPVTVNPNPYIAPGVTLQQYAYNVSTTARAYSNIPPYLLGYNPYPSMVAPGYNPAMSAYGGSPGYSPYTPSLSTGYNPYATSPYLTTNPGMTGGPSLSTTPGYGTGGYDNSLTTNPYTSNPYNGYNNNSGSDPYGAAALRGVADLTNATAQYQVTMIRARLMQEELTRSRLATRRLIQEEIDRERRNIPNPEESRQKDLENSLSRARRDPPMTEILSGKSLNDLFNNLATQQAKGFRGPNVPLDEVDLTQLNLSPGDESGNIGLLKNLKQGDKLGWPTVLTGDGYTEARDKLDARLPDAVSRLRTQKPVPDSDVRDLEDSVKKMTENLNSSIGDLSPTQYITGKRFLNLVQDAITAMKSPGAINYFNGTWVAKGKNVAELVNYMKEKGLKFAAATPGGDATYRALHHAMIAYDANMTLIATKP